MVKGLLMVITVTRGCCPWTRRPQGQRTSGREPSRPNQAGNGVRRLLDLGFGLVAALRGSIDEAVAEVVVQEPERDRLQGLRGRRDLGQDADAVGVRQIPLPP